MRIADIILLDRCLHTKFLPDKSPIYTAPVPIVRFYLDIWKLPGFKEQFEESKGLYCTNFFREYDVRITYCKELFEQYCPEWIDSMFWSPHCVNVQNYDVSRDIDILFWGKVNSTFRGRILSLLMEHVDENATEEIDEWLSVYKFIANGREYRFGVLKYARYPSYYGKKLYKLISRAKVCPTSPKLEAPVGKFFENAACGAVSLTIDFTDRKELGFEHGENIWLADPKGYLESLTYLLEHPDLVEEMSKNAKELIRTRHTPMIRGRELYRFLRKRAREA